MKYRELYPVDWERRARVCKERACWRCQFCGLEHRTSVISRRTGQTYIAYLAAAHLDHDPWNPNARLAALCPSCHMSYDYSQEQRRRWLELEVYRHQVLLNAYFVEQYYDERT